MRLPRSIQQITPSLDDQGRWPYPPLGFVPFSDYAFGDGDTFGLYWPIGLEDSEPIVAEVDHNGWQLTPGFSSFETFLAIARSCCKDSEDSIIEPPTLAQDARSPVACVHAAQERLRVQDFQASTLLLETAVAVLPEYTTALERLVAQYRRAGETDKAVRTAVQALRSPPCFGGPAVQVLRWLAGQQTCPAGLESDPLWVHRRELRFQFGGTKVNNDYPVLLNAVRAYLESDKTTEGITCEQTLGSRILAAAEL
jgi:hypothetical protein